MSLAAADANKLSVLFSMLLLWKKQLRLHC